MLPYKFEKKLSLPNNSRIAGGSVSWFIPFSSILVLCESQSSSGSEIRSLIRFSTTVIIMQQLPSLCHLCPLTWVSDYKHQFGIKSCTLIRFLSKYRNIVVYCPSTRQNMLFQSDAPEGSDTFRWQVLEEIVEVGLAENMGQVKIPVYSHRLMHLKRETCELHDSYFCLMTIKHAIPKILS